MIWSTLWAWRRWGRVKQTPARKKPSIAQLAVESLEERLVCSTTTAQGPDASAYLAWRAQTYSINDVTTQVTTVDQYANMPVSAQATPSNASFGSLIGLPTAFTNTNYRGQGSSVVVIDTGIDYSNTDLGGGFGAGRRVIAGWDFVNNDADPMDDNGHGTHVAGIIGSSSATYSGVAPGVNLIALKVLDATGNGTFGAVQDALKWVTANQAKYNIVAINLSLGAGNYTSNPYTFLDNDFSTLKSQGVFISVAAGNSYYTYGSQPGLDFPAVNPLVVSVGAVWSGNFGAVSWASGARDYQTGADYIASFSQRGAGLSLLAPGAIITSTYLGNTYKAMAGTSMAAPVVAGAAAVLHQALEARGLTANQDTILALMKKTGANVTDNRTGAANVTPSGLTFKRLDLGAALNSLASENAPPVLSAIPDQTVARGGSTTLTLNATDSNGDPLTYFARLLTTSSRAYELKQQLGLGYPGTYNLNIHGANEKWLTGSGGKWYCILPNGELRVWAGSTSATLQAANLVATLDASYYADPSQLWNAAAPTATVSATVSTSPAYQLKQQLDLGYPGTYNLNIHGANEKWMTGSGGKWYCILPNGELRRWAGSMSATLQAANLIATLDASYYNDPSLLWNAQPSTDVPPTVTVNGNQLTINAPANASGTYQIQVTASDGRLTSTQTFSVTVNAASAPTSGGLTNQAMLSNRAQTVTLGAAGSTYSAQILGTFSAPPATLVVNGNQLTIHSAPDFAGTFSVRVTTSNGTQTTTTTFQVTVTQSSVAQRFSADFNGDGRNDTAFYNQDGTWWVSTNNADGSFTNAQWTQWATPANWSTVQVADVNGDQKADIVGFATNGAVFAGTSTGSSFTGKQWAQWSPSSNWAAVKFVDLNGDGKADLFAFGTSGAVWMGMSDGSTFTSKLGAQLSGSTNWSSIVLADVDGNGSLDVAAQAKNGKFYVGYFNGSTYNLQAWTSANPPVGAGSIGVAVFGDDPFGLKK